MRSSQQQITLTLTARTSWKQIQRLINNLQENQDLDTQQAQELTASLYGIENYQVLENLYPESKRHQCTVTYTDDKSFIFTKDYTVTYQGEVIQTGNISAGNDFDEVETTRMILDGLMQSASYERRKKLKIEAFTTAWKQAVEILGKENFSLAPELTVQEASHFSQLPPDQEIWLSGYIFTGST